MKAPLKKVGRRFRILDIPEGVQMTKYTGFFRPRGAFSICHDLRKNQPGAVSVSAVFREQCK